MWKRRMTVRCIPFLVLYRKKKEKKKTQRAETKGGTARTKSDEVLNNLATGSCPYKFMKLRFFHIALKSTDVQLTPFLERLKRYNFVVDMTERA